MISLEELAKIREKMHDSLVLRDGIRDCRIIVGMGTCGIAAGARNVLNAFVEEVFAEGLSDSVTVGQSGCIGLCENEPVVQVVEKGKEKITYINMTPDKVKKVIAEHIKGGKPVEEFMLGKNI